MQLVLGVEDIELALAAHWPTAPTEPLEGDHPELPYAADLRWKHQGAEHSVRVFSTGTRWALNELAYVVSNLDGHRPNAGALAEVGWWPSDIIYRHVRTSVPGTLETALQQTLEVTSAGLIARYQKKKTPTARLMHGGPILWQDQVVDSTEAEVTITVRVGLAAGRL